MLEDEVDINLNPDIGFMWMRRGEQAEVITPGDNEKKYLAGSRRVSRQPIRPPRLRPLSRRRLPGARASGGGLAARLTGHPWTMEELLDAAGAE